MWIMRSDDNKDIGFMVSKCSDKRVDVIFDFKVKEPTRFYCRLSRDYDVKCVYLSDDTIDLGDGDVYALCDRP